jgi:hypothetical protein
MSHKVTEDRFPLSIEASRRLLAPSKGRRLPERKNIGKVTVGADGN